MRIVIIDDQKRVCSAIRSLIRIHCPEATVVGEAYNAGSAAELIKAEKPDVVLLDIMMPEGSGFDLLKKLRPLHFHLIFITAYQEYAVKAFRFAALDYLMKPVDPDELISALHKAREQARLGDLGTKVNYLINSMDKSNEKHKKIIIRSKDAVTVVEIKDIIRCEADDRYTTIYLSDGKSIVASETLKTYEELLGPMGFFRSHNTHLVNIEHIKKFEKRDTGSLVMRDLSVVPVAVRKKEKLLELLEKM